MYSILFTTILFLSSLFGGISYAQEMPKSIIDEVIEAGGVVVADVSIRNSRIVSQTLNELEISFEIKNNGPEQQSGIMYGLQLVKEEARGDEVAYVIIDEVIYPEEINLLNGQSVEKVIRYTAPDILTGKYAIHLNSQNKQGFPFAVRVVGDVELEATNTGVFINNTSCTVLVRDIDGINKTVLKCSAENQLNNSISVIPEVSASINSSFGEVINIEVESGEVVFEPLEKKDFEIIVNGIENPGIYFLNISLLGDNVTSNKAVLRYYVEGKILFISNAILDKESYQKGETANIRVLWAGNIFDVNAKVKLESNGRSCAKEFVGPLSLSESNPLATIDLSITRDCSNPSVSVELSDMDGNILDSQDYEYGEVQGGSLNKNLTTLLYVFIIIIAVFLMLTLKRKYLDRESIKGVEEN